MGKPAPNYPLGAGRVARDATSAAPTGSEPTKLGGAHDGDRQAGVLIWEAATIGRRSRDMLVHAQAYQPLGRFHDGAGCVGRDREVRVPLDRASEPRSGCWGWEDRQSSLCSLREGGGFGPAAV